MGMNDGISVRSMLKVKLFERLYLLVGFEPQIQVHQKVVEQLMVHLCNSIIYQPIWYRNFSIK
jgi:hypothetical protein